MPQSDKPKRLDLAKERTEPEEEADVSAINETSIPHRDSPKPPDDVSKTPQPCVGSSHARRGNDGNDRLVDTDDEAEDGVNSSTNGKQAVRVKAVTFLQETDAEFKLDDAGKHE
jgi:hypothetical protein